jgi:hypothetical protein
MFQAGDFFLSPSLSITCLFTPSCHPCSLLLPLKNHSFFKGRRYGAFISILPLLKGWREESETSQKKSFIVIKIKLLTTKAFHNPHQKSACSQEED